MKTIRVVAAVICDSMQAKRKIYATARGYGDYKGQWRSEEHTSELQSH